MARSKKDAKKVTWHSILESNMQSYLNGNYECPSIEHTIKSTITWLSEADRTLIFFLSDFAYTGEFGHTYENGEPYFFYGLHYNQCDNCAGAFDDTESVQEAIYQLSKMIHGYQPSFVFFHETPCR